MTGRPEHALSNCGTDLMPGALADIVDKQQIDGLLFVSAVAL